MLARLDRRGLMMRNQIQARISEHQDGEDRVLELLDDGADRFPVRTELDAGEDQQRGERQRAEEREHDEPSKRHAGHACRERDQGPDDRHHPSEEAGRIAVAREERLRAIEIRPGDAEIATPALDDRPAAPCADRVRDQRPDRGPERPRQHDQPVRPRLPGERLDRVARSDEETREGKHELGRDRDDHALDRDPQRDPEIPDGIVDLGDQVSHRPVQEVEHGREHSGLSSAS